MARKSGAATVDAVDDMQDAIIRAALEGIITVDEEQRIVLINPAAEHIFGVRAEDVLGRNLSQFIPARLRAEHARHVDSFRQSSDSIRVMGSRREVVGLRADGQEFPMEASISRTLSVGPNGPRTLTTVLLRDLTQIQELQARYESLQQQFYTVVDLAPNAIWLAKDDTIVFANRACSTLFGVPNGHDLVGRRIYDLLQPESQDTVRLSLAEVVAGRRSSAVLTEHIKRADGKSRVVEIGIAALPTLSATVQMLITDVTERMREVRKVERSRRALRRLSDALISAREDERRHIARELHDELAQRLSALKFDLTAVAAACERAADLLPKDRMNDMLTNIDETVAAVRRIASDLRPAMLDDLGLSAAIEWLAGETTRRTGIHIHLSLANCDDELDDRSVTALYRMAQETLTNIIRHAGAQSVWIDLCRIGADVLLTVEDDGVGFPADRQTGAQSLGLLGIRERARMLGGGVDIGNRVEGGARVQVRLPLKPPPAGLGETRPGEL